MRYIGSRTRALHIIMHFLTPSGGPHGAAVWAGGRVQRKRIFKDSFQRIILGQTVLTKYNNNTYKIDDVAFNSSPMETFKQKDKEITFKEYYRTVSSTHLGNINSCANFFLKLYEFLLLSKLSAI